MKIQTKGAAMKPASLKAELLPSTQLRKAVFGGSLLLGKSFLGVLAICAVAMQSSWIATLAEAATEEKPAANAESATEYKLKIPFGLEETAVVIPADNPLTNEKVELGRLLVFDKRLSQDNTIACMSCHLAKFAFTDGKPVATGIRGQKGGRSAPASINRVFSSAQFWDGRAATLEAQSVGPFTTPIEHGFANYDVMRAKMMKIAGYRKLFKQAFDDDNITIDNVGKAIASFQRTILSGNSPADRFDQGQEAGAISAEAQHGLLLFREKARCTKCHSGFNFTDEKFHNLGLGWDDNKVDLGRYMVTKNAEDIGAFKTPTLREVARSAPYTHDGRFKTLEEVVNFYNQGGVKNPHQDPLIIPLELTDEEKRDLVQFLHTLNGEGCQQVKEPKYFTK
jgi:cytochrome c peroxidase